jgi:energy-coupling factor transport system permease protein
LDVLVLGGGVLMAGAAFAAALWAGTWNMVWLGS